MGWFSDLRDLYRAMGLVRFTIFFGGVTAIIIAFSAGGTWLMDQVGWPADYGFQCRGKGCWLKYLFYSHKLLNKPDFFGLLLFAWLWLLPLAGALMLGIAVVRKWARRRKTRIRPMDY